MFRYSLFALLLFLSISALSQIKPKKEDWFAYDLTHNLLLNIPEGFEQSGWSHGHSLSFTDEVIFGTSNLGFAYGVGFTSLNFYSNVGIETDKATGEEVFNYIKPDSTDVNKFTVQYIHIPVELRFRSNPNAKGDFFRLYIGGKIGVRINSYSRIKSGNYNVQYNDLGSLNRFSYGVYSRIGYSFFSLYAYYGLSNVFEGNTAPASLVSLDGALPLCVGISLSL